MAMHMARAGHVEEDRVDDGEALAVAAGLVRDAGFEPVVVGKLVDARRFQRGAPGYGQSVTAAELRQKLSLTP